MRVLIASNLQLFIRLLPRRNRLLSGVVRAVAFPSMPWANGKMSPVHHRGQSKSINFNNLFILITKEKLVKGSDCTLADPAAIYEFVCAFTVKTPPRVNVRLIFYISHNAFPRRRADNAAFNSDAALDQISHLGDGRS